MLRVFNPGLLLGFSDSAQGPVRKKSVERAMSSEPRLVEDQGQVPHLQPRAADQQGGFGQGGAQQIPGATWARYSARGRGVLFISEAPPSGSFPRGFWRSAWMVQVVKLKGRQPF